MPCTQTGSLEGDAALAADKHIEELNKQIKKLTIAQAIACATLTFIEKDPELLERFEDETDWYEAGTNKIAAWMWWRDHKLEDEARRKAEADKKAKDDLKKQKAEDAINAQIKKALEKLSVKERKLLKAHFDEQFELELAKTKFHKE